MYGSSFMFATIEAAILHQRPDRRADTIPLPSEETTPPVTNTYLVCCGAMRSSQRRVVDLEDPGARRGFLPDRNLETQWGDPSSYSARHLARQELAERGAIGGRRSLFGSGGGIVALLAFGPAAASASIDGASALISASVSKLMLGGAPLRCAAVAEWQPVQYVEKNVPGRKLP